MYIYVTYIYIYIYIRVDDYICNSKVSKVGDLRGG